MRRAHQRRTAGAFGARAALALPALAGALGLALAQPVPPQRGPVQRLQEVDWEAVRTELRARIAARLDATLEKVKPEEMRIARLPVIMPLLPEMRAGARVFARPDSYSASFDLPEVTVEIFGSRIATELPEALASPLRPRLVPDPEGFFIQRTEYGVELSFERFNCSYNITLTCRAPETDARCAEPGFIRDLARRMTVVGGEPEGGL